MPCDRDIMCVAAHSHLTLRTARWSVTEVNIPHAQTRPSLFMLNSLPVPLSAFRLDDRLERAFRVFQYRQVALDHPIWQTLHPCLCSLFKRFTQFLALCRRGPDRIFPRAHFEYPRQAQCRSGRLEWFERWQREDIARMK